MLIRRAQAGDIPQLDRLLFQVNKIHSDARPDLFRAGAKKYTDSQLEAIVQDESTPVFAAFEGKRLLGYAFCVFKRSDSGAMNDIKTLYIDDLCVDERYRGQGVGKALYLAVKDFAAKNGCRNLTLNVWSCNASALEFYKRCGFTPRKTVMEQKLGL